MGSLRDRLAAELTNAITAGLDQYCEDLASEIREHAPVSHGEIGKTEKGLPVTARSPEEMSKGRTEKAKAERIQASTFHGYTRSELAKHLGAAMTTNPSVARSFAKFFKYTSGPNKGQSPDVLLVSGRSLRGASHREGGTLKRGIHAIGSVVEGTRIVARVRSDAPYSLYVETGHGPGGLTPGREKNVGFFRKPFQQRRVEGVAALARYVRRID